MRARGEAGQALPLVLVIVAAAAGAMLLVGALGGRALQGAQAQTAADAAALAGAVEGPDAAEELARLNGSTSPGVEGGVGEATVTARVGDGGRRRRGPSSRCRPGGTGTAGLVPEHGRGRGPGRAPCWASRCRSAPASGARAEQEALWADRASNPYPVARPGTSMHERGMAIDVPRTFVTTLRGVAAAVGLCQPLPVTDPVHFETCRRSRLT